MKKHDKLLTALFTIVLGVLFIILNVDVVSVGMTIIGAALIISSVLELLKKHISQAIIKLVIGIVIIVFGWTLVSVALYIMAFMSLLISVIQILTIVKTTKSFRVSYLQPIMGLIVAGCMLFNQGGTISWVFIVSGICLIFEGVFAIFELINNKPKIID